MEFGIILHVFSKLVYYNKYPTVILVLSIYLFIYFWFFDFYPCLVNMLFEIVYVNKLFTNDLFFLFSYCGNCGYIEIHKEE